MSILLIVIAAIGIAIYLFATILCIKNVNANGGGWVKTPPRILALFTIGALIIFIGILPMIFSVQAQS